MLHLGPFVQRKKIGQLILSIRAHVVKHMIYLTSAPWILGGATPLNTDIVNKNSIVG